MKEMLKEKTPRLFKLYEAVLNGYCRDKNLEAAKKNAESFQVDGSMKFMNFLKENGVKNYFVTGAVVEKGMGMHEEVETLGYKIGEGELVSAGVSQLQNFDIYFNRLVDFGKVLTAIFFMYFRRKGNNTLKKSMSFYFS
mgnify:CR=1 FL=1